MSSREILVLTPTSQEFEAVSRHLAGAFKNFRVRIVASGPGAINAAFRIAEAALGQAEGGPAFIIGAGTCGSLSRDLVEGEMIASAEAIIADWLMEDDSGRHYGPYGLFNYQPLSPETLTNLTLRCDDPLVAALLDHLEQAGFRRGRLMTSGVFVAGLTNKLAKGRSFQALGCDMESGVFAYVAQNLLGGRPWFNLRVVADTLDETLADYFAKEADMTDILGLKTRQALEVLDELLGSPRRPG
jgi:nucleoside phosphorylase